VNLRYAFTGGSRLLTDAQFLVHPMPVAVICHLEGWPNPIHAMLDTAAQWCVLPPFVAEAVGCKLEPDPNLPPLSTRFGTYRGRHERLSLVFNAEEGEEVVVDATFFVAPDWPGPPVIGWKGCLERIRFAVHPDPDQPTFCFADL
jgi:hypothetical protein